MVDEQQPRLLLSAATPGAAALILVALKHLVTDERIHLTGVISQQAAVQVLESFCEEQNIPFFSLPNIRWPSVQELTDTNTTIEIEKIITRLAPNAVLTGLSGPDLGIDEWLIDFARKCNWLTYSLQDAPGWVVNGISGPASTYFVQSKQHISQTLRAPSVYRAISVGPLKSLAFDALTEKINTPRIKHQKILFLGQPLWHIPGYLKTLTQFLESIKKTNYGSVIYRPHPLENDVLIKKFLGTNLSVESELTYEKSLISYTTIASCFSTGLQDAVYLTQQLKLNPPKLIYCLYQKDIREFFIRNSQSLEKTMQEQTHAIFLTEPLKTVHLDEIFTLTPEKNIKQATPMPEIIAQTIVNDQFAIKFIPQNYAANSSLDITENEVNSNNKNNHKKTILSVLKKELNKIGKTSNQFDHILPPQKNNLYLRTKITGIGNVFVKTIDSNQSTRLGKTLQLENSLSQKCPHVVKPISPKPISLQPSNKSMAIWPFLTGRPIEAASKTQLHELGVALGKLHKTMKNINIATQFAQNRVKWLLNSWEELSKYTQKNEYEWLNLAFEIVPPTIKENFLLHSNQLIHGDLNTGNVICLPGNHIMFIDFEEAIFSYLPFFFDLAMLIERQLMTRTKKTGAWQNDASVVMGAYIEITGQKLPYALCLFEAQCFTLLRSITILTFSKQIGRPWPDTEWEKFERLTHQVCAEKDQLIQFAEYYT